MADHAQGDQTIISLFVPQRPNGQPVGPRRQRAFGLAAVTQGSGSLTADHGFSTSVDISPKVYLYLSLGYSRSIQMDLDVWTFSTTLKFKRLRRS